MNFSGITRAFSKVGRVLKNRAPEIAIVTGVIGLVTATVLACKETPKVVKTLEDTSDKIEKVNKAVEEKVTEAGEEYSEEDAKHDKLIIYSQTGLAVAKSYGPAAILTILSILSIFAGGKVFRKRLTTVTGAYALLEQNFKSYRDGVIEKFGKDMDKQLRYKLEDKVIEEKTIDENGNEKTELKTVKTTKYDGYSDYARIFDETNVNWVKDGERNMYFLLKRKDWLNDKLRAKGYMFLNDVYDELGYPRTAAGQLVGWVYDPNDSSRDDYIDFGLTEILDRERCDHSIAKNITRSFLLDFNCSRIIDDFEKYSRD